jgi:DNA-binding MarR family transcriptional regulator
MTTRDGTLDSTPPDHAGQAGAALDDKTLDELDRALLALRRFLQVPRSVPEGQQHVEVSTVLVLDAVVARDAISIADVAECLEVKHSTASRLVQRAVEAGMVRRSPSDDPRRASLTPTPAGFALDQRAREFRRQLLRERLVDWTPIEVEAFGLALSRFSAAPRPAQ